MTPTGVIVGLAAREHDARTVPAEMARLRVKGNTWRLWLALAAVVAAVAGVAVPTASAGGLGLLPSCGPTTQPFAQWGDTGNYCAYPNLGLENGTSGWTLTGQASVVNGNETWHESGPGTHALQLGPGATALSAPLPINIFDPWIRFFARNAAANGALQAQVIFRGPLGNLTGVLNTGTITMAGYANWAPSQRILSVLALPLGTTSAQVLFTSTQKNGSWQIDDLYLDPCVAKVG